MSTVIQAPVSVDEYLHRSYRPDCDYIEGELQERNVGEIEHSELQGAIVVWFHQHRQEWDIRVLPEVRIQISKTRFRIADMCLVSSAREEAGIVQSPPLVVIEILSPEGRVTRYEERLADYRAMGIGAIWVIDPQTRRGFDCSSGSWLETTVFTVPESPIQLDLTSFFAGM